MTRRRVSALLSLAGAALALVVALALFAPAPAAEAQDPARPPSPTDIEFTLTTETFTSTQFAADLSGISVEHRDIQTQYRPNVPADQDWISLSSRQGITSLDVSGLQSGTSYSFRVRVCDTSRTDDNRCSFYRTETVTTRFPPTPTITTTVVSDTQVRVSWSGDATGRRIEAQRQLINFRGTVKNNLPWVGTAAEPVGVSSEVVDNLSSGSEYRFRARWCATPPTGTACGGWSSSATATT